MDTLNQLFRLYKETNKIKVPEQQQMSSQSLQFGDVLEIYTHNRLLIVVVVSDSEALLMSEFTELATHTDFIVHVDHPISDTWIIETNQRLYLTPQTKYNICCTLDQQTKTVLKDILAGSPVPIQKSGPKIPPNPKDPRMKFKLEELEKTMLVNKHLFYEEEEEGT